MPISFKKNIGVKESKIFSKLQEFYDEETSKFMANDEPPKTKATKSHGYAYDENFTNDHFDYGGAEVNFPEPPDWVWTDNGYSDHVNGFFKKKNQTSEFLNEIDDLNGENSFGYNYNDNLADYESYLEEFKNGELGMKDGEGNGEIDQSFLRKCSSDSVPPRLNDYFKIDMPMGGAGEKEPSQNGETSLDRENGSKTPELAQSHSERLENPYRVMVQLDET